MCTRITQLMYRVILLHEKPKCGCMYIVWLGGENEGLGNILLRLFSLQTPSMFTHGKNSRYQENL